MDLTRFCLVEIISFVLLALKNVVGLDEEPETHGTYWATMVRFW